MSLYERVADLPLTVEGVAYERRERETTKFTRATTLVSLSGDGEVGTGEDVTYDAELHPIPDEFDLAGEYTLDSFSTEIGRLDLFPDERDVDDHFRHYRRWAVESAALDLALRQADTDLGALVGREYDPVRFVVSPVLGDPPSADRIRAWHDRDPDLEFKLDADEGWTDDLLADLSGEGVRVVDFKAYYEDSEVAGERGCRPLSASRRGVPRRDSGGPRVDRRDGRSPRRRPQSRLVGLPDNWRRERPRPAHRPRLAEHQALAVRVGRVVARHYRVLRSERDSDVWRRPVRTRRGASPPPFARVAVLP